MCSQNFTKEDRENTGGLRHVFVQFIDDRIHLNKVLHDQRFFAELGYVSLARCLPYMIFAVSTMSTTLPSPRIVAPAMPEVSPK